MTQTEQLSWVGLLKQAGLLDEAVYAARWLPHVSGEFGSPSPWLVDAKAVTAALDNVAKAGQRQLGRRTLGAGLTGAAAGAGGMALHQRNESPMQKVRQALGL